MTSALQKITVAKQALEKARTIPEIKVIRDQAAVIQNYLKQQNYCLSIQNDAAELKLRAERKLGTVIPEKFPHGGARKGSSLPGDSLTIPRHRVDRAPCLQ